MIETGEGYVPDFILDDRRSLIAEDEWESDKAEVVEIAAYYKRASAGVWTWLAVLTVALAAIAHNLTRAAGVLASAATPGPAAPPSAPT